MAEDPVQDFMIVEAIMLKVREEDLEAQRKDLKRQEVQAWKNDRSELLESR